MSLKSFLAYYIGISLPVLIAFLMVGKGNLYVFIGFGTAFLMMFRNEIVGLSENEKGLKFIIRFLTFFADMIGWPYTILTDIRNSYLKEINARSVKKL